MKIIGGGGGSSGPPEVAAAGDSTNFVFLSEGCVSYILAHTSPRDACTAASICRGLKCLANSDAVWERFLPSDYSEIVSRSVSPVVCSSKKELYFRLCDSPVLIDDGNMRWGRKEELYCIRKAESEPNTYEFSKVAELLAVCWLEVKGKFTTKMLSPETRYAAYLVYNIGEVSHGLDFPAKTWVKHGGGTEEQEAEEENVSVVYLKPPKQGEGVQNSVHRHRVGGVPRRRADGWMEIELGKFYNEKMEEGEVEMGFKETQELHWKSGLVIEGFDIRPVDTDEVSE